MPNVHKNEKQVFSLLSHNIASQLVPDVWLGFFCSVLLIFVCGEVQ